MADTYCTDDDMAKYRSNIMNLGVDSWETQRQDAFAIINRTIIARWYNPVAVTMGLDPTTTAFDSTKVKDEGLKRLECFKALELAYLDLQKDSPDPDGFERQRVTFKEMYGEELDSVLGMGLTYDWSGDDTTDQDEVMIPSPRRLVRG